MLLVDLMKHWREIRALVGVRFIHGAIRYTSADVVRGFLEAKEVPLVDFATTLYAYDLFAQTLHEHFFIKQGYFSQWVKPEMPSVTGVLSTSGKRVCPALLPTMLLYCSEVKPYFNENEQDRCFRVAHKEKNVWEKHIESFNSSVDAVQHETKFLLGVTDPVLSDEAAIILLQEKYALGGCPNFCVNGVKGHC